jgi:hypothetical protein
MREWKQPLISTIMWICTVMVVMVLGMLLLQLPRGGGIPTTQGYCANNLKQLIDSFASQRISGFIQQHPCIGEPLLWDKWQPILPISSLRHAIKLQTLAQLRHRARQTWN